MNYFSRGTVLLSIVAFLVVITTQGITNDRLQASLKSEKAANTLFSAALKRNGEEITKLHDQVKTYEEICTVNLKTIDTYTKAIEMDNKLMIWAAEEITQLKKEKLESETYPKIIPSYPSNLANPVDL